jgi:hypothetical protein
MRCGIGIAISTRTTRAPGTTTMIGVVGDRREGRAYGRVGRYGISRARRNVIGERMLGLAIVLIVG